jgi:hypothetical protein
MMIITVYSILFLFMSSISIVYYHHYYYYYYYHVISIAGTRIATTIVARRSPYTGGLLSWQTMLGILTSCLHFAYYFENNACNLSIFQNL